MRAVPWLVLGCLLSAPALAGTWSSLWRTPDQQGEALLAAGHPARAAARFSDPRLKAYADLEAGRYAKAARLLGPFKDATSEYNRGNALARGGHLHAALAAYDAALKRAPHDKDIRHNRDLVARMLRHPPPKSPKSSSQGGHGKPGGHGKAGRNAGGSKTQPGGAGRGPGAQSGKGSQAAGGHSGRGASGAAGRNGAHSHSAGSGAGASGSRAGGRSGPSGATSKPHPGSGAGLPKRTPGQARRDAALAAALARGQRHRGAAGHGAATAAAAPGGAKPPGAHPGPGLAGGGTYTPRRKPVSEKTLALEQWLRQIPNNPAGLLRRKFLIEYMMRHRGDHP